MLFKIVLKGVTSSKELAKLSRITPKSTRSDFIGLSYMIPNIEQLYGGKEIFERMLWYKRIS
uniref:Uncharacterized protein n=1 Tax=Meloidogyne enterolobii TaxID=390850 RepID=A0A6V7WJZ2_MELEN|nr:unnamed protein product [Meloidogyne enterolobii]